MDFGVALRLTSFFVGAFLHGVLVFGVLSGARRRQQERVLRWFFVAILSWHAGSFLTLALNGASGPGALGVRQTARVVAFAGLGFLPSLLLHTVMRERWARLKQTLGPPLEMALVRFVYLPLAGLPVPLWFLLREPDRAPLEVLAGFVRPWTAWFVAILLATAGLSIRTGRLVSPRERRLDTRLAVSLVLAALGLTYVYLLDGRRGPSGYTLETVVMASSIVPSIVFTYHAYRYRVLGYVVGDRAVSILATASFVAFYLFFVREGTRRAQEVIGIPAAFTEGALLVLLVLLFEPYGDTLRALARRYLAGGRERLRRQVARAATQLTRALTIEEVAAAVDLSLSGGDIVARARLLVTEILPPSAGGVGQLSAEAPLLAAAFASGRDEVRRDDPPSAEMLVELERLEVHAALALRTQDRLHGALLLTGTARRGLYPEDLEDLEAVARGAALALASATLLGEKMAVERLAARAEKMASLGWLAASVAHEVKNPLSSIKSVAQVLHGEAGAEHPWRADLDVIVREVDRLDGAVKRLLRSGREDQESEVDLATALDRIEIALGPQARSCGVRIERLLIPGTSRVRAGADALWEVFYNLVMNALDAMPGGGCLRIQQQESDDPGVLVLTVSDDGPGIPPLVAARVFDPFFTTRTHGHGLGLAIVKRRLDEMGGSIRLLAPVGGAAFELRLPRAASRPERETPPPPR